MARARRIVWYGVSLSLAVAGGVYLALGPAAFGGPFPADGDEILRQSQKAYDRNVDAHRLLTEVWWHHQLFSWKWWVNLGLATIPWVVWVRLRPRASTYRLLFAGFVLLVISSYLDFIGSSYGFWRYHVELLPSIPSYLPWDFSLYPVSGMFFLQVEPRLSRYLKALLFASVSALVFEPIFIAVKFYEPVQWTVFHSFPLHYLNYLIADWASRRDGFEPLQPRPPVPPWEPPET